MSVYLLKVNIKVKVINVSSPYLTKNQIIDKNVFRIFLKLDTYKFKLTLNNGIFSSKARFEARLLYFLVLRAKRAYRHRPRK